METGYFVEFCNGWSRMHQNPRDVVKFALSQSRHVDQYTAKLIHDLNNRGKTGTGIIGAAKKSPEEETYRDECREI